ncbi:hypothetical protein [Nevskia sp.]|uniref:defense against restriction DarA-related protein n=1 Tax=Nevskia sp. TaxID=1929292 RepID=UPI0025D90245|nr:hypothetical protein [Nevskia sp.]
MSWLRGRFLSESEAIGLSAPDAGQRQYGAFAHGDPVTLLMCDFEGQPEGFEHFHCLGFVVGCEAGRYDIAVRIPPSAEQNSGAALYAVLRDIPEGRLTAYSGTDAGEGAEGVAFDSLSDGQWSALAGGRQLVVTFDAVEQPRDELGRFASALAAAKETFSSVVGQWRRKDFSGSAKPLMGVSDAVVGAAKGFGLDLSGYVHAVDVYALQHMHKAHSNPSAERARGQLPITEDDWMKFPEVTAAPDYVAWGPKTREGKDLLVSLKTQADGSVLVLEEIRTGNRQLALHSARKYPATIHADALLKAENLNARSDSGNALIVVKLTDSGKSGANSTDSTTCAPWAVIHEAAHDSAFGDRSPKPPTPAQCEAGNYKVGRAKVQGFHVAIENPAGSIRRGTDPNGVAWETRMPAHYGYLSGTTGADGDGIDCFIGPWPELPDIYVVNQWLNGRFDEHKVMFGCVDEAHARSTYLASYSPGWQGLRDIVRVTPKQLRAWLRTGNPNKPLTSGDLSPESTSMDKVMWDGLQPIGKGMAEVLYALRASDADEGLLFDSLTEADLAAEFAPGDVDSVTLDAIAIESRRIESTAKALQRALNAQAGAVKPVDFTVSKPRIMQGVLNVTLMYRLSDGQTLTIFFNNPDATPRRLKPEDVLVSWKWLLNRKDVTIVVAPERGRDLNLNTVALRVMALAEKNSAAFTTAQAGAAAKEAVIADLKEQIKVKTEEFEGLERQIAAIKGGATVPAVTEPAEVIASRDLPFLQKDGSVSNAAGTENLPNDWTGIAVDYSDTNKFWLIGWENGERSFTLLKANTYEAAKSAADRDAIIADIVSAMDWGALGVTRPIAGGDFTFERDGGGRMTVTPELRAAVEAKLGSSLAEEDFPSDGVTALIPKARSRATPVPIPEGFFEFGDITAPARTLLAISASLPDQRGTAYTTAVEIEKQAALRGFKVAWSTARNAPTMDGASLDDSSASLFPDALFSELGSDGYLVGSVMKGENVIVTVTVRGDGMAYFEATPWLEANSFEAADLLASEELNVWTRTPMGAFILVEEHAESPEEYEARDAAERAAAEAEREAKLKAQQEAMTAKVDKMLAEAREFGAGKPGFAGAIVGVDGVNDALVNHPEGAFVFVIERGMPEMHFSMHSNQKAKKKGARYVLDRNGRLARIQVARSANVGRTYDHGIAAIKEQGGVLPAEQPPAPAAGGFRYAMVNRPPMVGSMPKGMFTVEPRPAAGQPHHDMARHGVAIFERELTDAETKSYELAPMLDGDAITAVANKIADQMSGYADQYVGMADEEPAEFENAVRVRIERVTVGHPPSIGDFVQLRSDVLAKLMSLARKDEPAPQGDEKGADYPLSATYANTGGSMPLTVRIKDKTVRFHIAATDQFVGDYLFSTMQEMAAGRGLAILNSITADGETMNKVRQQIADFGAKTPAKKEPSAEFLMLALTPFMGKAQMSAVRSGLKGEEGGYFRTTLAELLGVIDAMPKTGETDGQGDEAVARLHYFRGGSDWYITEKDVGSDEDEAARYEKARKAGALITTIKRPARQMQAFGYTILNGDRQNAELGYINIEELTDHGVELDFHFTPMTIGAIKNKGKRAPDKPTPPEKKSVEPTNPARDAAKQFLMDAKAGALDFADPAMTEKLEAAYTPFAEDAEIAELFNDAVNAFVDFETARAATIA